MNIKIKSPILVYLLCCFTISDSYAQILKGNILDFEAVSLPGVTISTASLRTSTDIDGNFEIQLIQNQSYSIKIEFSGLHSIVLTNVKLPKGVEIDLGNIYMTPNYSIDALVEDKHGNVVCKHFEMSKKEKRQYLLKLNGRYSAEGKGECFEAKTRKRIQVIDLKRYLYDKWNYLF
ncbi:MAG: hypothetical protein ACI85I_000463 [Arenicella sp.]|jgi:hypothetical protein